MEVDSLTLTPPGDASQPDRVFHQALDDNIDAVIIGHPDGDILYANRAACEMFRTTEAELRRVGRPGITDPDLPVWQAMTEERLRQRQVRGVAPMRRPDGTTFLADVASTLFTTPDGERSSVLLRDVTTRTRDERQLAAYNEVVEALLSGADTVSVLGLLAKHARILFDATDATVVTPAEPPNDTIVMAADGPEAVTYLGSVYSAGTISRSVIDRREPVLIEDLQALIPERTGRRYSARSAMVAPIDSGDGVFGALFVGVALGLQPYGPADLELLANFARRAALVIALSEARADSERQQRRRTEQLQEALQSRIIIEQAKGIISATRAITPEEGFQRLRAYARSHSQDVHSVAHAVVDGRLLI